MARLCTIVIDAPRTSPRDRAPYFTLMERAGRGSWDIRGPDAKGPRAREP